jgi:hypothetical protein
MGICIFEPRRTCSEWGDSGDYLAPNERSFSELLVLFGCDPIDVGELETVEGHIFCVQENAVAAFIEIRLIRVEFSSIAVFDNVE